MVRLILLPVPISITKKEVFWEFTDKMVPEKRLL